MRILSLILITLTFTACSTPVEPIQEPTPSMQTDCQDDGNELPENQTEDECHNEL